MLFKGLWIIFNYVNKAFDLLIVLNPANFEVYIELNLCTLLFSIMVQVRNPDIYSVTMFT